MSVVCLIEAHVSAEQDAEERRDLREKKSNMQNMRN